MPMLKLYRSQFFIKKDIKSKIRRKFQENNERKIIKTGIVIYDEFKNLTIILSRMNL